MSRSSGTRIATVAPDQAHLLRLRWTRSAQPAVEGSGIPGFNPDGRPIKAGEFILGYPDETERRADADPEIRPQRHLPGLPGNSTYEERPRISAVPWRQSGEPRRGGPARREDGRPLAEQRAARAITRARRCRSRRGPEGPSANRFGFDDLRGWMPGRRACPACEPQGRPRSRVRASTSASTACSRRLGTSYGPMPPREGTSSRTTAWTAHHLLRLRRSTPQAAVRVRQGTVAERRHLHRRARREQRKTHIAGANERNGHLHHPSANQSAVELRRACRRS